MKKAGRGFLRRPKEVRKILRLLVRWRKKAGRGFLRRPKEVRKILRLLVCRRRAEEEKKSQIINARTYLT
jgi:ribosomal protein L30/L7E